MSDISDDYNRLPLATRQIAGRVIGRTRINQIKIDQEKAKNAYKKFMRETNDHIKNLEQFMKYNDPNKTNIEEDKE